MSRFHDLGYLRHIEEALNKILRYVINKNFDDIVKDEMLSDAVIRGFEIMGEASGRVSKETHNEFRELPWRDMVNMRNRLIHNYFDINHEIIWQTIKEELPVLRSKLGLVIQKLENDSPDQQPLK